MPFVEACTDGGAVAHKTISDNHDLYLYTNEHGEKKLLWNVVDDFLKDLASIRSTANLKKALLRVAGFCVSPARMGFQ